MAASAEAIREALSVLAEPGDVIEIRIPDTERDGVVSGYFNDFEAAAKEAARPAGQEAVEETHDAPSRV